MQERTIQDNDELAAWFLYHMTMQQRHRLIAERPVLYARAFPSVETETITEIVTNAIHDERRKNS